MPRKLIITKVTKEGVSFTIGGTPLYKTTAEFDAAYRYVCPRPAVGQEVDVPDGRNVTVTNRLV